MTKRIVFFLIVIPLIACSADQLMMERKISNLERKTSVVEQPHLIDSLLALYEQYQTTYPSGDSASQYCYRSIILYRQQRKHNKAVQLVEKGVLNYQNSPVFPKLLIVGGELYDQQFDEQTKAKDFYQRYLDEFPEGEDIEKAHFYFKPKDEQNRIRINKFREELYDERQRDGINHFIANQLIHAYAEYALNFDDEYTAGYCKDAAFLGIAMGETLYAVEFLTKIYEDHKDYPYYPEMLFHLATQYENNMPKYARRSPTKYQSTGLFNERRTRRMLKTDHIEKARYLYQELIENYAYHTAAESARMLLENLGKTPNEFVEIFLQKQIEQDSLLALDSLNG